MLQGEFVPGGVFVDKPRGLYDQLYGRMMDPIYRQIRAVTFDQDLGQTGWLTAAELSGFVSRLHLSASCRVLDVACGSGGASVLMAHETGAHVVGVDANQMAVKVALERAAREVLNERVLFRVGPRTRRSPTSRCPSGRPVPFRRTPVRDSCRTACRWPCRPG